MRKKLTFYKLSSIFASKQMSQEEVALGILGCSPSTLSCYMNAKSVFPVHVIYKLMEHFKISKEDMFEIFYLPYALANKEDYHYFTTL